MAELVENSFALTTHLLKKDLKKARERETADGYLNFLNKGNQTVLDYSIEHEDDTPCLVINFTEVPQRILLSEQKLTFGTRLYLTCGCGYRTTALYLSKGIFACRKCHRLRYESTTINRVSKHGRFLYHLSRKIKLISKRESIGRMFYKSKYTKRYNRWVELCAREGLMDCVADAKKLIADVNANEQKI